MSNDTNMDNRILAEFIGLPKRNREWDEALTFLHKNYWHLPEKLRFNTDRNMLHEVWEKFRELRFPFSVLRGSDSVTHRAHVHVIKKAMTDGTITDLYNALVQAVKWYNEVTKQKQ